MNQSKFVWHEDTCEAGVCCCKYQHLSRHNLNAPRRRYMQVLFFDGHDVAV